MAGRWRIAPETLWRDCIDQIVVLTPSSEDPLVLAGTAALLWDVLQAGPTTAEACAALRNLFPEEAPRLEADVQETLQHLAALEALHRTP